MIKKPYSLQTKIFPETTYFINCLSEAINMKKWFNKHKRNLFIGYAIVVPMVTLLVSSVFFVALLSDIEESERTFVSQMYHEGIGAAIVKLDSPDDQTPEIIEIPSVAPIHNNVNGSYVYYFSANFVNMTNNPHDLWIKVYIPKIVYEAFPNIRAIWTGINNKNEEQSGVFVKSDFQPATRPFTGYLAGVSDDFERVVWRSLYTGPIKVTVELS